GWSASESDGQKRQCRPREPDQAFGYGSYQPTSRPGDNLKRQPRCWALLEPGRPAGCLGELRKGVLDLQRRLRGVSSRRPRILLRLRAVARGTARQVARRRLRQM